MYFLAVLPEHIFFVWCQTFSVIGSLASFRFDQNPFILSGVKLPKRIAKTKFQYFRQIQCQWLNIDVQNAACCDFLYLHS